MYKRNSHGWSKHWDFILLDEIVLVLSFLIAMYFRHHRLMFNISSYRSLLFVLVIADAGTIIFFNSMHNVLKRGHRAEFSQTFRIALVVYLVATGFMFVTQTGMAFSRLTLIYTALQHLVFGYATRTVYKNFLHDHGDLPILGDKRSMLVIARSDTARDILRRLTENPAESYKVIGVVLDTDSKRKKIEGIPVVGLLENVSEFICREWVDAVYLDCPTSDPRIHQILMDCREMSVPVHLHIPGVSHTQQKQFAERIGGTTVLTVSNKYATPLQLLTKRFADIVIGFFGSVAALLIMAVVGSIIKKQSPGPILYKSERIGQNGKRFKMIKIRSMVLDAEDHKQELMADNRVKDDMMFKLDWDPRIIGNKELPDGTKKTGIGEFIRKTSLDEFPQFFNVLKGDMSIVGTRPPTPDEWEKYAFHHRARLSVKPGITGMWQVSGRSDINDFEEVVKLDTDYIQNWDLTLDVKIFIKTIWTVLRRKGAM